MNVDVLTPVPDPAPASIAQPCRVNVDATLPLAGVLRNMLAQARALKPSLVIVDLNSAKVDAVGTIASLKADPELSGIQTIGFASHVHADLIAAAPSAGADQVLPRSAFAGNLAEILAAANA